MGNNALRIALLLISVLERLMRCFRQFRTMTERIVHQVLGGHNRSCAGNSMVEVGITSASASAGSTSVRLSAFFISSCCN